MTPPDVTVPAAAPAAAPTTAPALIPATPAAGSTRDLRPLTPLWRISGRFTLRTPLHIGTGRDESITLPDRPSRDTPDGAPEQTDRHVAAVARDHEGRPCIPASSFKGALAELARRVGLAQELQSRLFGAEDRDQATTRAGLVEFVTLYLDPAKLPAKSELPDFATADHPHVAQLPHVSRNRHTGAAEHQRLYLQSVLPPGAEFPFECTARGLTEHDVAQLLGLLALAGDDASPLRLGAGQAADQGRIAWSDPKAQRIDSAAALWAVLTGAAPSQAAATPASTPPKPRPGQRVDLRAQVRAQPAAQPASHPAAAVPTAASLQPRNLWNHPGLAPVDRQLRAAALPAPGGAWLCLADLQLKFHSPFLVYQANTRKQAGSGEPDGVPRRDHQGRGLLPAHSLHGALRAQAERILRTVGRPTPEGYLVPAVQGLREVAGGKLDLASILFGAAGWRSLLRISEFTAAPGADLITHHMVAIDRLTGGGKDSAKFAIEALDCPTLTGSITLDLARLRRLDEQWPGAAAQVVGLLALVLRDLDEGDIPLGYGASKGYGQLTASTCAMLGEGLRASAAKAGSLPSELRVAVEAFTRLAVPAHLPQPSPADEVDAAPLTIPTPGIAAGDFHNPYTFIPFGRPAPQDERLPWVSHASLNAADPATGLPHAHSHAHYAQGMLSGRLLCRLTTASPVFVGAGPQASQTSNQAKLLAPFRLNRHIALPATSLRGMLSSLHESITRSAVRVMHETTYSVRQQTGLTPDGEDPIGVNTFASSALGRLVIGRDEAGQETWSVVPLTLPTLEPGPRPEVPLGYSQCCFDQAGVNRAFHKVLLEEGSMNLPFDCAYRRARQAHFDTVAGRGYWYLPIEPLTLDDGLCVTTPLARLRQASRSGHVIGQRPSQVGAHPLSEAEFLALPESARQGWVRGQLRIMKYPLRNLPPGSVRKFDVFVPIPPGLEQPDAPSMPCTPDCRQRFMDLADEQFQLQRKSLPQDPHLLLPYTPVGRPREAKPLRPMTGDLVFFKPTADELSVAEISFSSIWRSRVENVGDDGERRAHGTLQFLPDAHLAPLGSGKHQSMLSPSEMLFGAVELRKPRAPASQPAAAQADQDADPIMAFAGKVRFGHGRSLAPVRLLREAVTLKILSAPKPPSPAMYFHDPESPGFISKAEYLAQPERYRHRGRKVYLHALRSLDGSGAGGSRQMRVLPLDNQGLAQGHRMPWETSDAGKDVKQKVRIQPIDAGQPFVFEVDFDNLTEAELESLCASLSPHADFEHKLGMGKPIGLGSVRIDVVGLLLVDRRSRYSHAEAFSLPRYTQHWRAPDFSPAEYSAVQHLAKTIADLTVQPKKILCSPQQFSARQMQALRQAEPDVYQAVTLTGHRHAVRKPVHYPQLAGEDVEVKTFDWFVDNAKAGLPHRPQQAIGPIQATTRALPALNRTRRGPKTG